MPVYKDEGNNTWYSKFRYKDWTGRTRDKMKRGFSTKREALRWEREFKALKTDDVDLTFGEFVEKYKADRFPRLKATTVAMKDNIIETKILPYFANKKLSDITAKDIITWQNKLLSYRDPETANPFSRSYLKTIHNQINAIFSHGVKYYGLKSNPARTAGNMGSESDIRIDFWTLEEFLKFIEEMMPEPLAYYAFQMLYWCGLREGEMMALEKDDFDFDNRTVSITKNYQVVKGKAMIISPKTLKGIRTVRIPEFLCEELKDYFEMLPDDGDVRVFPVSKHYLHDHMTKGSKRAGVKRIRVHDLRHSHVSLLINMGYSAVAIADRMGHESIHITYKYAHMFPSVQTDMVESLNDLMEDKRDE